MIEVIEEKNSKVDFSTIVKQFKIDRGEVEHITQEFNLRINTDKRMVFETLLGISKQSGVNTTSLPKLFEKYFKGRANEEYTNDDLKDLLKQSKFPKSLNSLTEKVKKGLYFNKDKSKKSYISSFFNLSSTDHTLFPECLLGSSSVDNAVWFHFSNEIKDVCSGTIYLRSSPLTKLVKLSTFEINPFIASSSLQGKDTVSSYADKPQVTFNPNWLIHTLSNMDKQIFSKLKAF